MSPTIFRAEGFRFYFFSREEERMHVHVHHSDGEAKFWLDPKIELARSKGLGRARLTAAEKFIRERSDEIRAAWKARFLR